MKLVTIDDGMNGQAGVLSSGDEIIHLGRLRRALPAAGLIPASVRGILECGDAALDLLRGFVRHVDALSADAAQQLRVNGGLLPLNDTPLLAPIPDPRLILSAAANYGKHLKEFTAVSAPKYPTAFIKTTDSLSGHRKPIVIPAQCPEHVDFEGEMCFVIGRDCHNVSEAEAMSCVAGYFIANDVSARNWTPEVFASQERFESIRAWERNVMGKNLPGFTPCGPYLTTADEIADPHKLKLVTRLNGVTMQDGSTNELLYGIPQLIAYFSKWYGFHAGDVFTTGSPAGVGVSRKPQVFMKAGDRIEVEVEGLGTLVNHLVAGTGAQQSRDPSLTRAA